MADSRERRVHSGAALTIGHGAYAMADQLVVSGSRFLLIVLLGRECGEVELGIFALVISFVYMTQMCLQTLVTTPYANFVRREQENAQARYRDDCLVLALLLSGLACVLMALFGFLFASYSFSIPGRGDFEFTALGYGFMWASLAVPFILMVEFARRMYLIQMQGRLAFRLSIAVNLLLWITFGCLFASRSLSVKSAFIGLSLCNAIAVTMLWLGQWQLQVDLQSLRTSYSRNWKFGKYVFYSEALGFGRSNFVYWAILGVLGAGATGIYSACHSLMRVINPIFLGIAGVAEPSIAAGFASKGAYEVRRIAFRVLLVMVIGTLPLCLMVGVFSNELLQLFFGGKFSDHGVIVCWLAAAGFLATSSYPFSNAIQAVDRPDVNYRIRILTFVLAGIGVLIALPIWGLVGAAIVHFGCAFIALTLRLFFFQRLTRAFDSPTQLKVAGGETP